MLPLLNGTICQSLIFRLALAFVLVAVPPVLIASELATRLVTRAFDATAQTWLREATDYVAHSLRHTEEELEGVFRLLQDPLSQPRPVFSGTEASAIRLIGLDDLFIREADGAPVFLAGQIRHVEQQPLYPGGNLRWVLDEHNKRQMAVVLEKRLSGTGRTVGLIAVVSMEPYFTGSKTPSLALHMFVPLGKGFEQVFSSVGESFVLPENIGKFFLEGGREYFMPNQDWKSGPHMAHLFFQALRNTEGDLQAIFVSGATATGLDRLVSGSSLLFWGLLCGGLLLASSIGYLLAQRIVRPIRALDAGVQDIASGRFGHEVPEIGVGEVAGLARGFNMMSRQLETMLREKEQSDKRDRARMLGEIALGFAHEIRNPLLVIKTSAEVLYGRLVNADARDIKLLGFVVEEVERINTLISEFLGFAKPGLPAMAPESLSALAETALTLCRAKCDAQGIACILARETDNDVVPCDAGQMQQVLLNLILNAVDAMPDGGTLNLRVHADGADHVRLEVADTGHGISPDLLPTIQRPFVSTKEKGLGLGLAKVYAIVEEHGGSIACASSEGRGTTFSLRLRR
jgi:signal transduction histidine kinase